MIEPSENSVERLGFLHDNVRDPYDVVQIDHRDLRFGEHSIACDGDNPRVFRVQRRLADFAAEDLQFWKACALVSFDEHQIAGRKPAQQLGQGGFSISRQLVEVNPAPSGRYDHLSSSGLAMLIGVFSGFIDIERMMGVLDGRQPKPARGDKRNKLCEQRGLTGPAPPRKAYDADRAHLQPTNSTMAMFDRDRFLVELT